MGNNRMYGWKVAAFGDLSFWCSFKRGAESSEENSISILWLFPHIFWYIMFSQSTSGILISNSRSGGWWPCLWQGDWNFMILGIPSNPSHSMILWSIFLRTTLRISEGTWSEQTIPLSNQRKHEEVDCRKVQVSPEWTTWGMGKLGSSGQVAVVDRLCFKLRLHLCSPNCFLSFDYFSWNYFEGFQFLTFKIQPCLGIWYIFK